MTSFLRYRAVRTVAAVSFLISLAIAVVPAQQPDNSSVVRGVDAAVQARVESIAGYTVTEHYAVYRNKDEEHPVAEMTVNTTYKKETGKSYAIVAQSGSEIIRKLVLGAILDNEQRINQPGIREGSWLTSANYETNLKPGGTQRLDGRECLVLDISPKRKTPYLIQGTIWVDAKDYLIVQLQGTASKSSSVFTGATQMMRQYTTVNGFAMATHARATSDSFLFGQTIVKIDYQGYDIQLRPAK
jgi:outer membrane lipoprotein-sorting protein